MNLVYFEGGNGEKPYFGSGAGYRCSLLMDGCPTKSLQTEVIMNICQLSSYHLSLHLITSINAVIKSKFSKIEIDVNIHTY